MKTIKKEVLNNKVTTKVATTTCTNRKVEHEYKYRIEYRILVDEQDSNRVKREVVAVDNTDTDLVALSWYNENRENTFIDGMEAREIEEELEKYI